jgi:hypothetical protein
MIISLCTVAALAVPAAFAEEDWLDLLNAFKASKHAEPDADRQGAARGGVCTDRRAGPEPETGREGLDRKGEEGPGGPAQVGAAGDAYAQKSRALMATSEYHNHTLKERLNSIETPLRNIVKRTKTLSLTEEMALWAEVVYWITYDPNVFDNNFAFLEKENKISTKNMKGLVRYGGSSDYWYHQTRYANTVQGAIVLQYLQGDIKK